jgi:hypothetical protein
MTNYTANNHLSYSIGNEKFGYRKTPYDKFKVTLGKVDHDHFRKSDYRQELRRTADSVFNELGNDLVVFLSGGTDSEIVIRNFIEIGIKPRCATIHFIGGYNDSDVDEAKLLAKELDLDLEIIEFDIKNFLYSGEAAELGNEIQCSQITYLMVYQNILQYGAPAVMGGEALMTRNISMKNCEWYYTFRENEDASAMRFSEKYDIPLVNEWFSYTPELLLYYLEDLDMQKLFDERFNYKLTSVSSKNAILKRLYPEVHFKIKTHGFEKLLAFNATAYKEIGKNQIKRLESSLDGILMKDVYRMLANGN